jgi:hypothetical protein
VSYSPYEPPAARADARPAVILWFRVYAALMAVAYLTVGGVGVAMHATAMAAIGALLAGVYAVAVFVPFRPWGWTLALVAIGLGLASAAVLVAVPLLIHWRRPMTKAAFARF